MSKTVTLRLDEAVYLKLQTAAKRENRALSNFIETSALNYLREQEFADEFEMKEIEANPDLNKRLKTAYGQLRTGKGKFV